MPPPYLAPDRNGVTTIDAGFHRTGMAASHLIVDGEAAGFVDVGTSHTTPTLLAVLEAKGIPREAVTLVMVTHVHLDHAGGAGTLMAALPNARLVVHPRGARHMIDPSRLIAGATAVYGIEELSRTYGEIAAVPAERVVQVSDGDELSLGARTLRFLDTPGHARHHYCVLDPVADGVFTGDSFGLSYRAFDTAAGPWMLPTTTPVHFDPDAMRATVTRLAGAGVSSAWLTHWGRIDDLKTRARQLLESLDQMVALANAVDRSRAAGAVRQSELEAGLWSQYLPALAQHGCTLSEAHVREILSLDVRLNAQGIAVWLDRRGRR